MKSFEIWLYIIPTVAIAVLANSLSAIWAKGDDKLSLWLLAVVLISPFVFISFGLVASKIGVAISSGVVDSLLTISTVMVGLLLFGEWHEISAQQYMGLVLAVSGVMLMVFFDQQSV